MRNAALAMVAAEGALGAGIRRPACGSTPSARDEAMHAFAPTSGLLRAPQIAGHEPFVIFDCAHNPQAAQALAGAVEELAGGRPVTLLVACSPTSRSTNVAELLAMVPARRVICTAAANPRSLPALELASACARDRRAWV